MRSTFAILALALALTTPALAQSERDAPSNLGIAAFERVAVNEADAPSNYGEGVHNIGSKANIATLTASSETETKKE